jgi:23S rRNA (guanosine2251-2'-O)-methyltransferase
MPTTSFEIRKCDSCGLRYPSPITGDAPNVRCPACMGATRIILSRNLITETRHDLPDASSRKQEFAVLLDNIRSAWNVGSILRSADGFGFAHAYLCGITPTPEVEAVKKTSLGSENSVSWTYHKDAVALTTELKSKGRKITALEEHDRSTRLADAPKQNPSSPTLLIVGNEITGVDPHLLDLCDTIYHIPMHGQKKSFNVATAFGVAAYALTER